MLAVVRGLFIGARQSEVSHTSYYQRKTCSPLVIFLWFALVDQCSFVWGGWLVQCVNWCIWHVAICPVLYPGQSDNCSSAELHKMRLKMLKFPAATFKLVITRLVSTAMCLQSIVIRYVVIFD